MNQIVKLVIMAMLLPLIGNANATVLFQDSLSEQNTSDLTSWSSGSKAVIGTAPDGSNALTFTGAESFTPFHTLNSFTSTTGSFTLSFEVEASSACAISGTCGTAISATASPSVDYGFILANYAECGGGADGNGCNSVFPVANTWEKVTYTFNSRPAGNNQTSIGLEMYYGLPNGVFYRNLVLTDNPAGITAGTLTVSALPVPEPATVWLFGSALVSLFGLNRRKTV